MPHLVTAWATWPTPSSWWPPFEGNNAQGVKKDFLNLNAFQVKMLKTTLICSFFCFGYISSPLTEKYQWRTNFSMFILNQQPLTQFQNFTAKDTCFMVTFWQKFWPLHILIWVKKYSTRNCCIYYTSKLMYLSCSGDLPPLRGGDLQHKTKTCIVSWHLCFFLNP